MIAAAAEAQSSTPCFFMIESDKPPDQLGANVAEGLNLLAPHLKSWVDRHLIEPRRVRLATNAQGTSFKYLWLVTDHTGENDSNCRVVYDPEAQMFGLECTLDTGVEWYMGNYGSFSETVQNM